MTGYDEKCPNVERKSKRSYFHDINTSSAPASTPSIQALYKVQVNGNNTWPQAP